MYGNWDKRKRRHGLLPGSVQRVWLVLPSLAAPMLAVALCTYVSPDGRVSQKQGGTLSLHYLLPTRVVSAPAPHPHHLFPCVPASGGWRLASDWPTENNELVGGGRLYGMGLSCAVTWVSGAWVGQRRARKRAGDEGDEEICEEWWGCGAGGAGSGSVALRVFQCGRCWALGAGLWHTTYSACLQSTLHCGLGLCRPQAARCQLGR